MQIRPAAEKDVDSIQAVGRSAWRDTYAGLLPAEYIDRALEQWWSRSYLTKAIQSQQHILLVAEENDKIIGVAESQILDDKSAILWKLYVLKEHRRRGLGTSLVEESIRRLPSGSETYGTEYNSENKGAAAFYASQGFVFDRTEELDFGGRRIVSVYVKRALRADGEGAIASTMVEKQLKHQEVNHAREKH